MALNIHFLELSYYSFLPCSAVLFSVSCRVPLPLRWILQGEVKKTKDIEAGLTPFTVLERSVLNIDIGQEAPNKD